MMRALGMLNRFPFAPAACINRVTVQNQDTLNKPCAYFIQDICGAETLLKKRLNSSVVSRPGAPEGVWLCLRTAQELW